MSSQDEGGRRPDYPPWSGEPAGPDILEQGSDRPPTRWRSAVRWRRPPTVAVILGVAGLLVGLAVGYEAGTMHAGKATALSGGPGATASPTISPIFIGGTPGQFPLRCSVPAGATGTLPHLDTTSPTPPGMVIMIFPSTGITLTCRASSSH